MKYLIKDVIVLAFLFITSVTGINAQNEEYAIDDFVRIELNNGKNYKGKILNVSEKTIEISIQEAGIFIIERKNIKKIKVFDPFASDAAYDYDNPLYSKYYLGESAIGLKQGEGYYQNIMIVGNFFAYGFTDNFSVSAGFESVSLLTGLGLPVTFVNPKLTFHSPNDQVHFGVGNFLAIAPVDNGDDDFNFGGTTYGTVTAGDKNNNISFGIGLPYGTDGGFSDNPILQLAGMGRLSNKLGVVGEIMFGDAGDNFAAGTVNLRFITKHAVFDVGAAFAKGSDFGIPVASAALIF